MIKTQLQNPAVASNDANYRARRVTSDGTFTAVTTGSVFGTPGNRSSNLLLHKVGDASDAPVVLNESLGGIYDVVMSGGYLYIAGDRLGTINLSDPTLALHLDDSVLVYGNRTLVF